MINFSVDCLRQTYMCISHLQPVQYNSQSTIPKAAQESTNGHFLFGASNQCSGFNGRFKLDDAVIYNIALTAQQVESMYAYGSKSTLIPY